ncbi:MAG: DKNYY domain-containing protein [Pseudomonadota bacterium]
MAAGLLCAASAARVDALVCSGRDLTSYRIERGEVIHVNHSDHRQIRQTRMIGADPASFRALGPSECFAGYAADRKAVYYEGARIAGADPQSFRPLEDNYAPHLAWYAMDRERWYGAGVPLASRRGGELRIVNPGYATHPEGVFYGSRRLERDDFEVLGFGGYARSRSHVYFRGEVIAGVDARSFRLYPENPGYGRDRSHVVMDGKVQTQIDVASFTLLAGGVGRDRNHLYWGPDPVAGVDPAKVVWLGRGYWKDDKSVFFSRGRIEGADARSFRLLQSHAIDKRRVYHHDKPLAGIDAGSFQEIGFGYGRDKTGVYHYGRPLEGADGESFAVRIDGRGHDKSYGYDYNQRACAWAAKAGSGLPLCDPAGYGRR